MRFRSKIDAWILVVLVIAMAGLMSTFVVVMSGPSAGRELLIVTLLSVFGVALILSVLMGTHYTVADGEIRIVSGPFRWTVRVAEILDIQDSRNPLSSPALSLDRLRITYGHGKYVLVSPADKDGFLKAIEQQK